MARRASPGNSGVHQLRKQNSSVERSDKGVGGGIGDERVRVSVGAEREQGGQRRQGRRRRDGGGVVS